MYKYKVEFSYLSGNSTYRSRWSAEYNADSCQVAADMARKEYGDLDDMRVDRVWKENYGSWMAVNAWR